jgi:GNAT superfamily N-acetyltransferase
VSPGAPAPDAGAPTVRAPGPGDRAAWGALWHGYLEFYGTERPEPFLDAYFARLLRGDRGGMQGLVAVCGGEMLGLAHYCLHPHGWQEEPTCYLQDLFTAPRARGRGVGAALIDAVAAAAEAQGARGLYWTTARDNAPARRLYDRVARLTPFVKYARP